MRSMLIASIFAVFALGTQVAKAAPGVVYDPVTGNITFNELANVGAIQIRGEGVPAIAPAELGGLVEVDPVQKQVTWAFLLGAKNGTLNGGNVFPTGLLQTTIESSYYAGVVIAGSGNDVFAAIPITGGLAIPEPATMAMAGLGLIGLVAVRRRNG